MIPKEFEKPYDPKNTEERIYKRWEESGFFNPDNLPEQHKEPFTVVLPPPNVTGVLHLGHALEDSLQDAVVRYKRMKGFKTLWVPGTDHAAIATETRVEKDIIKKEEKSRHDLGREEFLKRVETFARESHDTIVNQVRRMGASLDWSREAYTLDEKRSLAVRTAFKKMYDDGLIYRGGRIVNWDPKMQTTVSDDEVEWVEETVPFYYLKYGPFTIGTARPETKFGDKYVVMHPDDVRYKKYAHGEKIEVEWINGPVVATIIKDTAIDMEFGTGVMTITPNHDATDFDIAERHDLPHEQIIDLKGKLLPIAGEFSGMHIKKARPLIVEKLKKNGLVEKIEEKYTHRIATNSRGNGVIEPQILTQWFVAVEKEFPYEHNTFPGIKKGETVTLKKLMKHAVESKQVSILPERFEKVYYHWIDNLRDWCISRQIWFGHRIPVWYRGEEIVVGNEPKGDSWAQDPDTLDTWFSSALWSFSTLGWPEKTKDLETYHPNTFINPGYEILFFWLARMILMSTYLIGEVPFKTIYLHGILRDKQGRKFSKSLGNGIDPIEVIEKFGTDALRMSLIVGIGPGNDANFDEGKVKAYKLFANKLWNITRFVLERTDGSSREDAKLSEKDASALEKWRAALKDITKDIEAYNLYLAAEKLYHYAWHEFADVMIEESKSALMNGSDEEKQSRAFLLNTILDELIRTLHPFMPFVTEEIWRLWKGENHMLMIEPWPLLKQSVR